MSINTWGFVLFLILFGSLLIWQRKRIVLQPLIKVGKVPLVYLAMLRTSVGLKLMDTAAKRFGHLLGPLSTFGIGVGFVGMVWVTFEIIYGTVQAITTPVSSGAAALVLPIEAKGVVYVPFVIWIISLGIIIAIHEFGHGVIARLYNIPIKSSGVAALGLGAPILPAAFVEPDEKILVKRPMKQQLAVFSAGPFANVLLAILLLPLLVFGTMPVAEGLYSYQGVTLNEITADTAYPISQSGISVGSVVTALDGTSVSRLEDFVEVLSTKTVGETVMVTLASDAGTVEHAVVLGAHPTIEGAGYLGVVAETTKSLINDTFTSYFLVFVNDLMMWLVVLNLGIGLFNLLPLGIVDGGRMAKLVFERYLHRHHTVAYTTVSASCLLVVLVGVVINFIR